MAQQHLDPTDPRAGAATGEALAGYLRAQAMEFLRALRLHRETGGGAHTNGTEESVDAARALRRSARRISGSLHTFRPLLDPDWSEGMRPELAWLSGTLALEHAYESRLTRLLTALHRLSGIPTPPAPTTAHLPPQPPPPDGNTPPTPPRTPPPTAPGSRAPSATPGTRVPGAPPGTRTPPPVAAARPTQSAPATGSRVPGVAAGSRAAGAARVGAAAPATGGTVSPTPAPDRGNLTIGAAKSGALLDRQLTLARTRAHSTALQALGSSRFHAVADKVAVLASEVPLTPTAPTTDLRPLATAARERLTDAVTALPLLTAGHPYNAEALIHGLSPDPSPHPQDAPWHQVRLLLRLHRYALEVLHGPADTPADARLHDAGHALDRHRDASEAASAAAQAARTPRIAPATAYALGVLHADQRHEVEAARFAFQQAWQKETVRTP
ncbi:CHAD domain-containing protein [Streptomyces sp. NPDC004610]|uniref:CHAD domain-containing protein n=1 Tax=unclassified Streptomyces TaxID=2593676 RepID=UPI0033A938E0